MIPSVAGPATSSGAERLLFAALTNIDLPGWTAFHSLYVSEHEYKRWGELDFVLLSQQALLVIEVKGGGIACHEGVWTFTDRYSREHISTEGPFRQAASGLMGLRARLGEAIPAERLAAVTFGYGVAFPQADFDIHSVEWDDRTVLDRRHLARGNGLVSWLRQLVACWREHTRIETDAPNELVAEMRQLLRPEFDRVPPLAVRIGEVVTRMEYLTEEQYTHLDFIEGTARNLIEGGAGTGKTFLAVELARREVARGRTTLYTCQSSSLSRFVRDRVPPTAEVWTSADLPSRTGPQVQSLIVDEGQDLTTLDHLDQLGRQLQGGLDNGRWTMFLDPNVQSHMSDDFDADALELIRTMGSRGILKRNCRNTQEIVLQTRLMTGADLGNPMAGSGPQVGYAYYSTAEDCAILLDRHLRELSAAGVDPGAITILSTLDASQASIRFLSPARRRQIAELDAHSLRDPRSIAFATVREFKGLESDFVVLIDVDNVSSDRDTAALYVGMTRARAGLWIAINRDLRPQLGDAIRRRGLSAVIAVGIGA